MNGHLGGETVALFRISVLLDGQLKRLFMGGSLFACLFVYAFSIDGSLMEGDYQLE